MYWTLELASKLEDAPWPATKDELIDFGMQLMKFFFPFGLFCLDFTGKYARGRLFELLDPPVDLRLVDAKLRDQLGYGLFTGKGQQLSKFLGSISLLKTALIHRRRYASCARAIRVHRIYNQRRRSDIFHLPLP